jgi:hypothetical protein
VDPGSQTTGMVLVGHFQRGDRVIWAAEIQHRGETVKRKLLTRRQARRSRRSRKTRYRPPRFNNRRRPEGWLVPSLRSRAANPGIACEKCNRKIRRRTGLTPPVWENLFAPPGCLGKDRLSVHPAYLTLLHRQDGYNYG